MEKFEAIFMIITVRPDINEPVKQIKPRPPKI
jgi:hypothetical protein